jgi:hypothetical protein
MLEKFWVTTEINYPNHVNKLKQFSLKKFLELNLKNSFFFSTNYLDMFSKYKNHPRIKVFHYV